MRNSLPTNFTRFNHHVSLDPSCPRCGASQETIIHALRDCPKSKRIWEILNLYHKFDLVVVLVSDWLHTNAITDYGVFFILTCWFIWRARNDEVFNDHCQPIWAIINSIKSELTLTSQLYGSVTGRCSMREVVWTPPPDNVIKVNVDGSSLGNPGPAGFGGLIRNHLGEWICGFSGSCGFADNLAAELQGINYGLELAWHKGYRNVILESDSKCALDLLTATTTFHSLSPLLVHINSLLIRDWNVKLQHNHREGNECADWMAKKGATGASPLLIWDQCPHQLDSFLLADALGIARLRL